MHIAVTCGIPYHQAGAVKMHASQTEEISELALHDQLHEQQAVSSFQRITIVQKQIQYKMLCQTHSKKTNEDRHTLCSHFCCSSSVRRTPIPSSSCLSSTSIISCWKILECPFLTCNQQLFMIKTFNILP